MWRAYGNGSGVALVLKPDQILRGPGHFNLQTSPVAYLNDKQFESELERVVASISANLDLIKSLNVDAMKQNCLSMLRLAALCSKHPGFEEEKEWRLIYSESLSPSKHIKKTIETINGVPQLVCKIPLRNLDNGEFTGSDLADLIDRIIIGPTQFPDAMANAFIKLLEEQKVPDARGKIFVSDIPLRT